MSESATSAELSPRRSHEANFKWEDPFRLNDQLSEDERLVMQSAHDYCQSKLMPRVLEAFRNE